MLRDEPSIRAKIYHLPRDPLAVEILIPAMRQARVVRGAFGWFSAGWIPELAPGLAAFLANPNADRIKMVVSPALYPEELEALMSADQARELAIQRFGEIIEEAGGLAAGVLANNSVDCLAWMYATGLMELQIAVPRPGSNYHPKVWEFSDEFGDRVAVLGSANATGRAFRAAEHMQVECSWDRPTNVQDIEEMIDAWWLGKDDALYATVPLSKAVERQLLERKPDTRPEFTHVIKNFEDSIGRVKSESFLPQRPVFRIPEGLQWRDGTYAHQGEAVQAWEQAGRRGILEMATGAGKTKTALICAYQTAQSHPGPLLVVITAPTTPLVNQWKRECGEFGLQPLILRELTPAQRRTAIPHVFDRLRSSGAGAVEVIVVSDDFIKNENFQNAIMNELSSEVNLGLLHISDEAHGLGTERFLDNAPEFFTYRLGLSATPDRKFDDEGTKRLKEYFGDVVYEFGLDRAIGFCLSPYKYFITVVNLDEDELADYRELSARIGAAMAVGADDRAHLLMIKRREIIENAGSKVAALSAILQGRKPKHLLVYCSAKNPDQLDRAREILADLRISATKVTQEESSDIAKLNGILESFEAGYISALLAKKVLDEGVDIPSTKEAILLASSTVEREWIQRRGRVLRMAPGKDFAVIHDVIALPPPQLDFDELTFKIVQSECKRVREFAGYALNTEEIMTQIGNVLNDYKPQQF